LRKFCCYIISFTILSSCSLFERTDDILLARLGDSYLYESEVKSILNSSLSSTDSLAFIQQYIQNWAKEELLLEKAELNIDLGELDIEQRLEDYRKSLLIHAYEQKLIQQSNDTLISFDALTTYFKEHADDFILAENIVQPMLVRVSEVAPELDSLETWVFSKDSLDLDAIEAYAHQYAKRFYYNPNEWLNWREFMESIPSVKENDSFFEHSNTLKLKDSLDVYFVRLFDLKEQGEIAPLEYVQEEIKSILLNQKKLRTVDVIQSKLLEDAKKSKQFEIY
jgi:hypothetical protein